MVVERVVDTRDLEPPRPLKTVLAAVRALREGAYVAMLLLLLKPQTWLSRWTGATLATVHLLALGVISMVMLDSLFQVVPVLGGCACANHPPWVHVSLTLGTALLSASLLRPDLQLWGPALAAAPWPSAGGVAVVLLAADFGLLMRNLCVAVSRYRRASGEIEAALGS